VHNPRREAKLAKETPSSARRRAAGQARAPGAPRLPSFRSVLVRSGIAAAIFFVFLVVIIGDSPAQAALFTAVLAVVMIPLGMLIDRLSYRVQMRRFEKRRAAGG
jgi:hypothetical protein